MAEEIRDDLTSKVIEAKTRYCAKPEYDFSLPSELTVTITLHEYRDLILAKGEYEEKYNKEHKLADERYWEIDALKKENVALKENLLKYVTEETKVSKQEE